MGLILDFLNLADLKERNKGIEPNKPTIYRSAVGNWAHWAKLIPEVAQIQGPKTWIVCCHTTFQQLVYGDAALISFSGLDTINFVCSEVNTIVGHSMAVIRHCKQEGLQPSLAALYNAISVLAQKVLLLCIDFSPTNGGGVEDFGGYFFGIWSSTEAAVLRMNYS